MPASLKVHIRSGLPSVFFEKEQDSGTTQYYQECRKVPALVLDNEGYETDTMDYRLVLIFGIK